MGRNCKKRGYRNGHRTFAVCEAMERRVVLSAAAGSLGDLVAHPMLALPAGQTALPAASGSSSPTGITPAQMRKFYGVDKVVFAGGIVGDGRGQTIAVVNPYDVSSAFTDLQHFDSYWTSHGFNLPDPPSFTFYNQLGQELTRSGGSANPPQADTPGDGWGWEEALDVQWAHVIAPAANIILVETNDNTFPNLFTGVASASTLPSSVNVVCVTMSWGVTETDASSVQPESVNDNVFTTTGVSYFGATGDAGEAGTNYPAASPNVIAVGGTSITLGAGGSYGGETAWSSTGGQVSPYEAKPSYQNNVLAGSMRGTPDVSMAADPNNGGVGIYDSNDFTSPSSWAQFGGTSLATPMWAALVAMADQGRAQAGLAPLSGRSQVLPMLYSLPSTDFHDVTMGSNGSVNGMVNSAGTGYDTVTGLGTPFADRVVTDLGSAPTITGTGGVDTITLTKSSNLLDIDWAMGTLSGQVAINSPAGLTINGNGGSDKITLNYGTGSANPLPNFLHLNGTFTISGLSGTNPLANTMLEIARSTVYFSYTTTDPITNIKSYLKNGYNGGAWSGAPTASTGVITSTPAAQNLSQTTGIGYADSADGLIAGQPVNTVELKYTLYGDTTLTGTVGFNDFTRLTQHYNKTSGGTWDIGDFNYDSSVNTADFTLLSRTYNTTLGSQAGPAAMAASSSSTTDQTGATTTTTVTSSGSTGGATGSITPVIDVDVKPRARPPKKHRR